MGISNANTALLLAAKAKGIKFGNTATLGVQSFWPTKKEFCKMAASFNISEFPEKVLSEIGTCGAKFLKYLGAEDVSEIDASDFEGARIIHDMNLPISSEHWGKFDFIYDGGSIEHIYKTDQVFSNVGKLLKNGGTFACSTCANNLLGHGFYQFSPELFFRVFTESNGWNLISVMLCEHQKMPLKFWKVTDPEKLKKRIEIQNKEQVYILILAQKINDVDQIKIPQQSDYKQAWESNSVIDGASTSIAKNSFFKKIHKRILWQWYVLTNSNKHPWTSTHARVGFKQPGLTKLNYSDLACGRF